MDDTGGIPQADFRTERVTIRLTPLESELLAKYAGSRNRSKSGFVRGCVLYVLRRREENGE